MCGAPDRTRPVFFRNTMKKILTIAASDSSGGAGIQADIKTITAMGAHALSVLSAITAQNTVAIDAVHPVPEDFIKQQLDTLFSDIGIDAVKTGMLLNPGTIRIVAEKIRQNPPQFLVIDPVMTAKTGNTLLTEKALEILKKELLPLAFMVTPNLDETFALTGIKTDTVSGMKKAARMIADFGPQTVLIKGGHLKSDPVDVLYDGHAFTEFSAKRLDTPNSHGTGCTLSAAIAVELANGRSAPDAVRSAKAFTARAIAASYPLGKGHGPVSPAAAVLRDAEIYRCANALVEQIHLLQQHHIGRLIPEIQSNFGYLIPHGSRAEDVVAFPGRIVRFKETVATLAFPEPGISKHIAKIILTASRYNPQMRCAMNLAFKEEIIAACKTLGFSVGEFSRSEEPPEVKSLEGSTMEWGTQKAIDDSGAVPDVIFDRGGPGKEPITRILGTDPADVAAKIIRLSEIV